ncbi:glycosyltransferase family 4 protein [Patescibacteria group bacterium]
MQNNKSNGKKIGIILGQIRQMGGVGIAAFEEVRNLRRLGYDAELIILMDVPGFKYKDFTHGIPIRQLSHEFPKLFQKTFRIPGFSFLSAFHLFTPFLISKYIKRGEYDFIFAHETYNILSALKLWQKNRIPYGGFVWDPASYILPRVYRKRAVGLLLPIMKPIIKYYDRKLVRHSRFSTVCSNAHYKFVRSLSSRDNIKILHPGCDIESEAIPAKRGDYLLALSKWDIGKNPEFFLRVLKKLKNKKVKLIIAGNWVQEDFRREFISKVKQYGLGKRIEFIGRVAGEEKNKLFRDARFLIHPIFEAFGMFALEAAAWDCASILPAGSGVNDIFKHGQSGFFPKEGDVTAFATCLDKVLADPKLAYDLGYKARKIAERNTWKHHTDRLAEYIESSLAKTP